MAPDFLPWAWVSLQEAGESRRRDKPSRDGEEVHREDVRRDRERRKDDRHREGRRGEDSDPEKALAKLTAGSQRRSSQGDSENPSLGRRHLAEPEVRNSKSLCERLRTVDVCPSLGSVVLSLPFFGCRPR